MTKAEVEVIVSEQRRRHCSRADERRVVNAALQPGATILGVARAFGVQV
jgi:transposase